MQPRDSRELAPEDQQHDGACHHPQSIGDGKGHQGLAGDRLAVGGECQRARVDEQAKRQQVEEGRCVETEERMHSMTRP